MKILKLSNEFSSKYRKQMLKAILDQIRLGKFKNLVIDPNKLYLLHLPVRREYQTPKELSGYNWGEEKVWEMGHSDENF